jgi:hypothetical protein
MTGEDVVACFKVLSRHSPEMTENNENYLSGLPVSYLGFEASSREYKISMLVLSQPARLNYVCNIICSIVDLYDACSMLKGNFKFISDVLKVNASGCLLHCIFLLMLFSVSVCRPSYTAVIICCHEYDESFFKYYNYHSLNERTWLS